MNTKYQVICGAFQATGYPGVIAILANWFGEGRKGFIMGLWNASTAVGNLVGGYIAGMFEEILSFDGTKGHIIKLETEFVTNNEFTLQVLLLMMIGASPSSFLVL